jgi:hypothetical protein
MKEKTIKVYKVEELQGNAREKAFNDLRESVVKDNFNNFYFFAKDIIKHDYKIIGDIYFSLSYSQGDGLYIESEFFNSDKVIDMLNIENSTKKSIKELSSSGDIVVATGKNIVGHYTYSHPRQVDLSLSKTAENLLPKHIVENIEKVFVDVYMTICGDLEKQGYQSYDVTDKDIIEFANENELEYLEDGRLA